MPNVVDKFIIQWWIMALTRSIQTSRFGVVVVMHTTHACEKYRATDRALAVFAAVKTSQTEMLMRSCKMRPRALRCSIFAADSALNVGGNVIDW